MANPTDAREAFFQEVFGEIVLVEKSVKETASQVRFMVTELRHSETVISNNTKQLLDAASKLAISNDIVHDKSKKELKWAIDRIETATADLARAMQPLTDLTLGLREVGRVEAKKQIDEFLGRKEKKLDSMLAIMDVFLQQIEVASERLPQLITYPHKVSQVKECNIEYLKSGISLRAFKLSLQKVVSKVLNR